VIRIEIIANHSVEENIFEAFQREKAAAYYTRFPSVFGVGASGPRMGDAIWPEENIVIVVWCEDAEAERVERAIGSVKQQFPDEGIKLFKMSDAPRQQMVYLPMPEGIMSGVGDVAGTAHAANLAGAAMPPARTYAGLEEENR
jgi:hypothetical protein